MVRPKGGETNTSRTLVKGPAFGVQGNGAAPGLDVVALQASAAQVTENQRYLNDHTLNRTEEPGLVYGTCYQVGPAVQDPRAPALHR